MRLICPDCGGELETNGKAAHCPSHGGQYEVLFDREAESRMRTAERELPEEETCCVEHPRQSAVADCATCGKALCVVCTFDVRGRHYCSDCAVAGAQAAPPPSAPVLYEPPTILSPITSKQCPMCSTVNAPNAGQCAGCGRLFGIFDPPPAPAYVSAPPSGLKCAQHPESPVASQCRGCSSGMCVACDFVVAGGIHFCPDCIDNAGDDEMSPRRKKFVVISLLLAIYCTIMFFLLLSGALYSAFGGTPSSARFLGVFAMYGIYVPAIIGAGLGWSAHEPHLKNTTLLWTVAGWNATLVTVIVVVEAVYRLK
ncbi:MAG TPA: hypothetical protein VMU84_08955 [Thermoanaerobaculia bacterium]|nr:hypothetical protein [Thermoanaerobaculia bacterium]